MIKIKEKPHYVNNREFSLAVVDYVREVNIRIAEKKMVPKVPDYIARCFLKISEGLSHKSNFIRYTYREEMVMDAVENCLKAISNYDIDAATRSGNPNAFSYFTQICWYAFLRRIAKEKKQQDIKLKYITEASVAEFILESMDGGDGYTSAAFVDQLRNKIDFIKEKDTHFNNLIKEEKAMMKKRKMHPGSETDSDLTEIFG